MKYNIIILLVHLLICTNCRSNIGNRESSDPVLEIQNPKLLQPQQTTINVWKQYKKFRETRVNDTTPDLNCFIKIEDSSIVTYYKNQKFLYKDSIYREKDYVSKRYKFVNFPSDVLIFVNENEIIIRHNFDDGDVEYFRKDK